MSYSRFVVVGALSILLAACATTAPDWVMKGGAAFPGDDGKFIYGVGLSTKSVNPAAVRERADHRARVDIARSIKTYVGAFTKDFIRDYPDYFDQEMAVVRPEWKTVAERSEVAFSRVCAASPEAPRLLGDSANFLPHPT